MNGKRLKGTLTWKNERDFVYYYCGAFNEEGQFDGKGILADERGTYSGDFMAGIKWGKGYYKGVNGIKYRGDYK
jgi:hypothetical protein